MRGLTTPSCLLVKLSTSCREQRCYLDKTKTLNLLTIQQVWREIQNLFHGATLSRTKNPKKKNKLINFADNREYLKNKILLLKNN